MGEDLLDVVRQAVAGPLLDLGAGWGRASRRLLDSTSRFVLALDPHAGGLQALLGEPRASVMAGVGEGLPVRAGSLAAIIALFSLHHLADQALGVDEACRALKPGGLFLVVDWTAAGYMHSPHSSSHLEKAMRSTLEAVYSGCFSVSRLELHGDSYLVLASRIGP